MLEAVEFTEPRVSQQEHILSLIWYDMIQHSTVPCFIYRSPLYQAPDKDVRQPRVEPNQDHEQQLWPK